MTAQYPILSFVERAAADRIPVPVKDMWSRGRVEISGSEPSSIRVRACTVGTWWVSSVEGRGPTRIDAAADFALPEDFALLSLTASGQYRSVATEPLLGEPNSVALGHMERLDPFVSWGNYAFTFLLIPHTELLALNKPIPYGRSASASAGRGAVLAGAVRSFCNEAFRMYDTTALTPLLPELRGLIFSTLDGVACQPHDVAPPRKIDHLLNHLKDNLADAGLSPKRVAAACGLSERQLYRCFAAFGESFSATLRRLRLERAAQALRMDKGLSISQVARDSGFATPLYFSQAFRESYKLSPRKFRDAE